MIYFCYLCTICGLSEGSVGGYENLYRLQMSLKTEETPPKKWDKLCL